MTTITPGTVVQACDQSQRQWNLLLRRHGQRSGLLQPTPQSPLALLASNTGQIKQVCLNALREADTYGFVIYLGEGRAHITPKGRRLITGPLHRWATSCSRRCRLD